MPEGEHRCSVCEKLMNPVEWMIGRICRPCVDQARRNAHYLHDSIDEEDE